MIQEYLKTKGVNADVDDVHKIINLFNAVNGDWLLRLVSSKKANKDSTFSREKISIVAAIKFMLAFLKHSDILWVSTSEPYVLLQSPAILPYQENKILNVKIDEFEEQDKDDNSYRIISTT